MRNSILTGKRTALIAFACAATCLGLAQSARERGSEVPPMVPVPPVPLQTIPTDRYLDLGAAQPREASDTSYTQAGAPWSGPEVPGAPRAHVPTEHRYVDLGRERR